MTGGDIKQVPLHNAQKGQANWGRPVAEQETTYMKRPKGQERGGASTVKPQAIRYTFDLCVSSLRRGQAKLLCIAPILTDDPRRES